MRYVPPISPEASPSFAPLAALQGFSRGVRWPVMAIMILYAYLAFHAFSGSQGLMNWMNNEDEAVTLRSRLENIEAKRVGLETRVNALDASHLDVDALNALSREKLYYSHPKDITIWLDPKG